MYDVGLTIASDAIIVVVQREETTGGDILVEDYTTFTQAVDALEDADNNPDNGVQFKGEISAVLNDRGTAEFVVLKSTTPVDVEDDDHSTPGSGNVAEIKYVRNGDGKAYINLYDKDGNKVDEDVDVELYQLRDGGYVHVATVTVPDDSNLEVTDILVAGQTYQFVCGKIVKTVAA